MERKAYPTDVSDEEWALVAPYLTLLTEDAPQCDHSLREVLHGLRGIVRAGAAWRLMPHDLPPWHTVYQPSQRWLKAGVFATMVHDRRAILRPLLRAAHCNRRLKGARGPALMGPSAAAARKCIGPWIAWGIC